MNKRQMYNRIMESVAKKVMNAINESITYMDDEDDSITYMDDEDDAMPQEELYAVVETGGPLGVPGVRVKAGRVSGIIAKENLTKEEATEMAKRYRKRVTTGERKYYKIGYSVVPMDKITYMDDRINESFEFEYDELGDVIANVVAKNESIKAVVKNADANDWNDLLNKMAEMLNTRNDEPIPAKITNLRGLSLAILSKMDRSQSRKLGQLSTKEIAETAAYIKDAVAEGATGESTSKAIADRSKMQGANSAKPAFSEKKEVEECGNCKDGKCKDGKCIEKKEVKETNESWKRFAANARKRYL